jgi:hypothetical protein
MRTSLHRLLAALVATALPAFPSAAQTPAPPAGLTARDHPWDDGRRIDLTWELSPDDGTLVQSYQVLRAVARIGGADTTIEFQHVEYVPAGTGEYTVQELVRNLTLIQVEKNYAGIVDEAAVAASLSPPSSGLGRAWRGLLRLFGPDTHDVAYVFRVVAIGKEGSKSAPVTTAEPVHPVTQWFDGDKIWFLQTVILFCGAVVLFIELGRRGYPLKVRKIAGLQAVDEAVGRATEMGRSCLFIPGIQDMNNMGTIAGINILARVAKTAAQYDAKVEVPTSKSLVMTAARETVEGAYLQAGRPDAYNEDLIYYVTEEQFGYVAYLQGMMVREKPAVCFYMGAFFAESLILAETGNSIGAIQIAGTTEPSQLPFFVAACDYTLIGEEFFAASAYLTGSPEELGSLKGQDMGKILVAAGIILGSAALSLAVLLGPEEGLGAFLYNAVDYFTHRVLT